MTDINNDLKHLETIVTNLQTLLKDMEKDIDALLEYKNEVQGMVNYFKLILKKGGE